MIKFRNLIFTVLALAAAAGVGIVLAATGAVAIGLMQGGATPNSAPATPASHAAEGDATAEKPAAPRASADATHTAPETASRTASSEAAARAIAIRVRGALTDALARALVVRVREPRAANVDYPVAADGSTSARAADAAAEIALVIREDTPAERVEHVLDRAVLSERAQSGECALRAPALHPLRIGVRDGAAGQAVELLRADGSAMPADAPWFRRALDPDGETRWTWLEEGEYCVAWSSGRMRAEAVVTIPTDAQAWLIPAIPNSLRVEITDGHGVLAVAGLKQGDFVRAVDGVEAATADALRERIAKRIDGLGTIQFRILRDSVLLEVEVPVAPFQSMNGLGGSFRPAFR